MDDKQGIKLSEFPCRLGGVCEHVCDSTVGCYRENVREAALDHMIAAEKKITAEKLRRTTSRPPWYPASGDH